MQGALIKNSEISLLKFCSLELKSVTKNKILPPAFTAMWGIMSLMIVCQVGFSTDYFVDVQDGNDASSGESKLTPWKSISKVNEQLLRPGDSVLFRRDRTWSEHLEVDPKSKGTHQNPITFGAYGKGADPVIREFTIRGDYFTVEDIAIDQNRGSERALRLRDAKHCVLRNLTVRNGTNNGIDIAGADGLIIESCLIHHFMAGTFLNSIDAHGIVAQRTRGLSIRNTEVHHVSGDSFQADPGRTGKTNDVLIENCHFWTGPLSENFSEGWIAGEVPGENAIDTKVAQKQIESAERMRITLRNIIAHGWVKGPNIKNRAAFNIKEKVEAIIDSIGVYECEIAFRLRGTRGNANATISNAVISDCEIAIRAEDSLANLKVYNSTFGTEIVQHIILVPKRARGGLPSWDIRNCAFLGTKPLEAQSDSNTVAFPNDFIDCVSRDYRLRPGSRLIDAGDSSLLDSVKSDKGGAKRFLGSGYDIGAYESDGELPIIANFTAEANKKLHAPLTVTFKDLSKKGKTDIVRWEWDFGDGNFSSKKNPVHTYSTPGIYSVELTVFDGEKSNTRTKTDYIIVAPFLLGDLNGDGAVNSLDSDLILKFGSGEITQFPVQKLSDKVTGFNPGGSNHDDTRSKRSILSPSNNMRETASRKAAGRHYTVSVPKLNLRAGQRIQVPVTIDKTTGLSSGEINLRFDASVITPKAVAAFDLLSGCYWISDTSQDSMVRFAFTANNPLKLKGAGGQLFIVEFEARPNVEGKESPLTFDHVELSNSSSINKNQGGITILPTKHPF